MIIIVIPPNDPAPAPTPPDSQYAYIGSFDVGNADFEHHEIASNVSDWTSSVVFQVVDDGAAPNVQLNEVDVICNGGQVCDSGGGVTIEPGQPRAFPFFEDTPVEGIATDARIVAPGTAHVNVFLERSWAD